MRYLRLLTIFFNNCLLTHMEYRANFVVNMFMSFFWLGFAILGLRVFFHHSNNIGGWSYYEVLLVVGLFSFFNGLIEAVLEPNMRNIVEQIRLGTFDFVLARPVNSQFLATMRLVSIWKMTDILLGAGVCLHAVNRLGVSPSVGELALFGLLVLGAAVIIYSLWLLMVTTAFWFVQIENITELFMAAYEAGRFPVTAYPGWMRGVFTFVVPVAFITTFPASALLGRLQTTMVLAAVGLAAGLFVLSSLFWRFALRHYSSASS